MVSSGAAIVYGQSLGRGGYDKIHKVFTADIYIILVLGAALTLAGELFTPQIARLIGVTDDDIMLETVKYFRGLFLGIIPTIMIPSLVAFLNIGNEVKYGMASSVVMAGINLALGTLNVYVIKGDMFVIGLSSAIAEYVAAAFLIRKFIKRKELGHLTEISGEINIFKHILLHGLPAAILEAGTSIRNIVLTAETLKVGEGNLYHFFLDKIAFSENFMSLSCLICSLISLALSCVITCTVVYIVNKRKSRKSA